MLILQISPPLHDPFPPKKKKVMELLQITTKKIKTGKINSDSLIWNFGVQNILEAVNLALQQV